MRNNVFSNLKGRAKEDKGFNRFDRLKKIGFNNLTELIFIFQLLALILLLFYDINSIDGNRIIFSVGLIFIVIVSNKILPKITRGDNYLLCIATMLFSIGIVMIYRLNPDLGMKQIVWLMAGIVLFYSAYAIIKSIRGWERWTYFYLILCLTLFVATLLFGKEINNAKNWLRVPIIGTTIQPSEFIKIGVVFFIASYYYNVDKFRSFQMKGREIGDILFLLCIYVFIGFLFIQKDLGTVVILFALLVSVQFVYEENRKLILANCLLAILGSLLAVLLFNHVRVRILTWLNPWAYIDGKGYQITQSLFAIASGGFFGTGIGMGKPDSIPLPATDFIFASICEEMGIFMGMAVIMLLLILVYRGYKIALSQKHRFYKIVAFGLSTVFAIQSLVIFGGVLKLIPLTGITIPFVSYGGSSVLSSFISLGILQFTSEDLDIKEALDERKK